MRQSDIQHHMCSIDLSILTGACKILFIFYCQKHQAGCLCDCRYIPERLLHARGTPRCIFLILMSALTALVVFFNAFASLALLFPASIMAGLAFGGLWSLMATLTSEFFGLHHFASNYTFVQVRL